MRFSPINILFAICWEWLVHLMWNKKEMSRLDATLTWVPLTLTFDLEFSRSNCISGMGGPIVTERKGRESIGCPEVKHKGNESTGPWPWIFKVKFYLGNGRANCHGTKGTRVDRMLWYETQKIRVSWMLRWLGYLWPWPLTLNFQGQIVYREWEAQLSSWSWNKRDGSR